jgi:hypothetical protein
MKRKSVIRVFSICVALIFVVLASGCVSIGPAKKSYSGDKLQKSEVAVIRGRYYYALLYYDGVVIYKIDGKYMGLESATFAEFSPGSTKVEVLPGWHELVILHYVINLFGFPPNCVRAAFNFEAGHKYRIKTPLLTDTGDLVTIIDVNTGVTIFSDTWGRCRY